MNVPDLNISDEQTTSGLIVTITTIPNNATVYYNGVPVTADQNITNFDNTLLTIDPQSGDQNVTFNYTTTDGAGTQSDEATVSMSFKNIIISGTLFNDGNGNGNVDGNETNSADGISLYVTLLDASGTEVASKALENNGTYYFDSADGLAPEANYTIVLTKVLHGLDPSLPTDWNNADGENIGLVGLDGNTDGINGVELLRENIPEINFGINKKPVAEDTTEAVQFNPGGVTQVVVPDLNISDNEDNVPTTVTITQLPTNGTLYYEGTPVVLYTNITDVNLSAFTIDSNDGDVTSTFKYTTTDRAGVVSDEATVTLPFTGLKITGNVFNDGNNDNTINGTGVSVVSGTQLYVTLLDVNGTLVASRAVNVDGTYAFEGTDGLLANSTYSVVLGISESNRTAGLPLKWSNNDGEHIGTNLGTDGNNDGVLEVSIVTSNIEEVNFGINKEPVAGDVTEPLQLNPGTNGQVNVPSLAVTDSEDGTPSTVTIVTLPSNGTLYYNGVEVNASQVIPNFDNALLTVDPDNGDQIVSFTYTTTDAVGDESEAATVTMSFDGLEISGNIFNDGNNDGTVNGTSISTINTTTVLYATLLDDTGAVFGNMPINADGSYGFTGLDGIVPDANYTIVLSIEMNATTPTLPSNWNNADGEHIGTGVGLDANADGKIAVEVVATDVPEVNFGINKKPVAEDKTEVVQINPGADKQVAVPTLGISDNEETIPSIITITTLPTNAILYYEGTEVTLDANFTDANLSKFSVNPIDGDVTVAFNYTTTDSVGVESAPATVTMTFVGLQIAGNIFNDGHNDGIVNGTGIAAPNGVQLFVTLVDANGSVRASHEVQSDGSYLFSGIDGIISDSSYRVVLSTSENKTTENLPTDWNNEDGEHIGINAGTDGSNDGMIVVNVQRSNVEEVNFGINKQPVASDVTEPLQLNPGAGHQVNVPNLVVSDNEDSTPSDVTIVTLPRNGTLYYNGVAVTAGQVFNDFNNSLLTIDPDNGDLSISFTYTTTDAVGVASEAATVSMSFEGLEIRGNVFNDGNNDGTVNGTKISQIESSALHATLLDENGSVMATTPIKADGSYKFTGLDGIMPNSNYEVIVSIDANATTSRLLSNWNSADGEHVGAGVGLDGHADGRVVVNVLEVDVPEVNFGINKKPVAEDKTEVVQINPGADKQVAVPTLGISDNEERTPSTIIITSLPTNGTLYYEGVRVTPNMTISNVNLNQFTVDPIDGDVTVTFNYTTMDSVGVESAPATVTMPFYSVGVSGQVFMDRNRDGKVEGLGLSGIEGLELYVNIVDSNGSVIASVLVDENGSYAFDSSVGLLPDEPYTVRLSKDNNRMTTALPTNFMHLDTTGVLEFTVTSHDIRVLDFGLNQQPVVLNVTAESRVNPGTHVTVVVPDLNISMNEDGITTPTTVTLSNLPNNGTLYYEGKVVTEGQVIHDFNNTLLTVDPDEANLTVLFTYTSTDEIGFESQPATVSIPFFDADTDGDGIPNNEDLDDDNDGILDIVENNTSSNNQDSDLDGIPDRLDLDSDGDGILDLEESHLNPTVVDTDGNGVLDSTTDVDKDGVMDSADANDNDATSEGSVTLMDTDKDGQPDFQDVDSDNDGLSDLVEGGTDATLDMNTDGVLDNQTDTDRDGIADLVDSDNGGTSATTPDTDKDGMDNYRDLDSDSDGLFDVIEIGGTDENNDGHINPTGTLVSGINLPDENANGIPDVLEVKLQDDIKRAAPGETVILNLLENDSGDIDKSSIKLVIPQGFRGVARLSADGKRMIVDGEGEWSVDENGTLTFIPEEGFIDAPTSIQYKASSPDGTKEAVANVTIVLSDVATTLTDVAGATTDDEECETYTDNSVAIFSPLGLVLLLLLSSVMGFMLTRKER